MFVNSTLRAGTILRGAWNVCSSGSRLDSDSLEFPADRRGTPSRPLSPVYLAAVCLEQYKGGHTTRSKLCIAAALRRHLCSIARRPGDDRPPSPARQLRASSRGAPLRCPRTATRVSACQRRCGRGVGMRARACSCQCAAISTALRCQTTRRTLLLRRHEFDAERQARCPPTRARSRQPTANTC